MIIAAVLLAVDQCPPSGATLGLVLQSTSNSAKLPLLLQCMKYCDQNHIVEQRNFPLLDRIFFFSYPTHLLEVRNWQQLTKSIKELQKQRLQIAVILSTILSREDRLRKTKREKIIIKI